MDLSTLICYWRAGLRPTDPPLRGARHLRAQRYEYEFAPPGARHPEHGGPVAWRRKHVGMAASASLVEASSCS
jgi:hypothetical protein